MVFYGSRPHMDSGLGIFEGFFNMQDYGGPLRSWGRFIFHSTFACRVLRAHMEWKI